MASEAERKLERDLLVRNRLLAKRDVVKGFVEDYNHSRDSTESPSTWTTSTGSPRSSTQFSRGSSWRTA